MPDPKLVTALCLHDAYDSSACFYYEKGRSYQIDPTSDLAKMTTRPLTSTKVDQKTGEIVPRPAARPALPVFQFDSPKGEAVNAA